MKVSLPVVIARAVLLGAALGLAGCGQKPPAPPAKEATGPAAATPAPPAIPSNPLKEAYFGEQHLHTQYSLDAFLGGEALSPDDAYKFAQGAEVEVSGVKFRIDQPLDWAAVTDHAEYLGEMYSTLNEGVLGSDNPQVVELRGLTDYDEREGWFQEYVIKANRGGGKPSHPPFWAGPETSKSGWKKILEATAANYKPGKFTTIPAYEWSGAPKGGNLHRNVFFRDIDNVPDQAMGYAEINREDELWQWLAQLETQGITAMAIPHNSNASKGMMFDAEQAGRQADQRRIRGHAQQVRARHRNDADQGQFGGASQFLGRRRVRQFRECRLARLYSGRDFNKFGKTTGCVRVWARVWTTRRSLGVNPYQYGIVGGTDSHNGTMANVAEDNFMAGSHGAADGTVENSVGQAKSAAG